MVKLYPLFHVKSFYIPLTYLAKIYPHQLRAPKNSLKYHQGSILSLIIGKISSCMFLCIIYSIAK